jgi:hypothetical protein
MQAGFGTNECPFDRHIDLILPRYLTAPAYLNTISSTLAAWVRPRERNVRCLGRPKVRDRLTARSMKRTAYPAESPEPVTQSLEVFLHPVLHHLGAVSDRAQMSINPPHHRF